MGLMDYKSYTVNDVYKLLKYGSTILQGERNHSNTIK